MNNNANNLINVLDDMKDLFDSKILKVMTVQIITFIYAQGSCSNSDIKKRFKLTSPSVSTIVRNLSQEDKKKGIPALIDIQQDPEDYRYTILTLTAYAEDTLKTILSRLGK